MATDGIYDLEKMLFLFIKISTLAIVADDMCIR